MALAVKNLPVNAGDFRKLGLIPGLGRPPGGGHGNPLQYFCLKDPMDRRAQQAIVHRFEKSWTQLKRLRTHSGPLNSHIMSYFTFPINLGMSLVFHYFREHCTHEMGISHGHVDG